MLKKLIALLLVCSMIFSGCEAKNNKTINNEGTALPDKEIESSVQELEDDETLENVTESFGNLDDPDLLRYVKDTVYDELVDMLDGEGYFVQNVDAIYVSKEYIEEYAYNSQGNIYFGYSLTELDSLFQGTRYVFTLGEDNQTTVKAFEAYNDTYEKVIRNVAVGTGVILICVTVSVVSGGLGAPAVSMIFAASAKTGTVVALSSGVISGVAAGTIAGIKTGDMSEAVSAAVLAGSESFKWGAISGALTGGITEATGLYGAAQNGLTVNEAATIQKESKYPLDIIKEFKSMDEYKLYRDAGLRTQIVNGKTALVRDIDLGYMSQCQDGTMISNYERMKSGLAPIDPATGQAYQLHHINQNPDGTLAILTQSEHQGNYSILNEAGKLGVHNEANLSAKAWDETRKAFWKHFVAGM